MINRVGKFEKVSQYQFKKDMRSTFNDKYTTDELVEIYNNIKLPVRATKKSAGYDIHTPIPFELNQNEGFKIPSGIRVRIDDGWWLMGLPKSGLGFKYRVQLDNTLAMIDGDYYDSDNEGHIMIKITNDCKQNKTVKFEAGDKVVQSAFLPYGITYDDETDGVRNGGLGSTGA